MSEAYGDQMSDLIQSNSDTTIANMLQTAVQMRTNYDYYIPPVFTGVEDLEARFNTALIASANEAHAAYETLLTTKSAEEAFAQATAGKFNAFMK